MTTGLPRVSVCLLTYKRAAVLPGTLDSLLAQTHGDFELVINDDRSPDETEVICREYERRDPRVRYFKNPVNLRYANNQNAAIVRARHDLVAIVHDGDVYRADLIERWTRAMVEFPTAALVFNALEQMDAAGRVVKIHTHPYPPLVRGLDLFDEMIRRPDSPIFGIVMVRKPFVWEAGPFDPELPTLADVDMWMRLLLEHDAAYIPEPLLRIAPREPGHHNNSANWAVRAEHEKIYALNLARRFPGVRGAPSDLRGALNRMHWRERIRALAYCAYHGRWRALVAGVHHVLRLPDPMRVVVSSPTSSWGGVRV